MPITVDLITQVLGIAIFVSPTVLLGLLGLPLLFGMPLNERWQRILTQAAVVTGLLASTTILLIMLCVGTRHVAVDLGEWVSIPAEGFRFKFVCVFDRLSAPMVILTFVLCGTVSTFASAYMHREPGYTRFFLLFAVFKLGMIVSLIAGTIEMLFAGWELVGLSSALLVAFFHERTAPVRNGLRVWIVYRLADAAFLIAAVVMHRLTGEGEFDRMMGVESWPYGHAAMSGAQAMVVGLLLLIAAAGKSALIPFCGWLPRAMEGPTPSSAVFYGALFGSFGSVLVASRQPHSGEFLVAIDDRGCFGACDGRGGHAVGAGANRHQKCVGVCLDDSGGDHRGRNWTWIPIFAIGPYDRPRLSANVTTDSRSESAARLPWTGKRHRWSPQTR